MSHPLEFDAPTVLVLLSRQNACENLALRMYARSQNLSPSEEAVLLALCRGLSIPDIAKESPAIIVSNSVQRIFDKFDSFGIDFDRCILASYFIYLDYY